MEIRYYACDTTHQTGEFCRRKKSSYYFFSYFSTPFVYESNGMLKYGNAGDFLITPPDSFIYHGPQSNEDFFVNDWIYVKGDDLSTLLKEYPLPYNKAFHIGDKNHLKNCIRKIQKELPLKQKGYDSLISCYLTESIIKLHRLYQNQKSTNLAMSRIESAKELILQNVTKDWTLNEMAELSGYSASHFSSLYTQRFGQSPKADLLDHRIQLAKQMLYYGEQSISQIAKQCGFQSIYYFSKYFKESVGISPSDYVKQVSSP